MRKLALAILSNWAFVAGVITGIVFDLPCNKATPAIHVSVIQGESSDRLLFHRDGTLGELTLTPDDSQELQRVLQRGGAVVSREGER